MLLLSWGWGHLAEVVITVGLSRGNWCQQEIQHCQIHCLLWFEHFSSSKLVLKLNCNHNNIKRWDLKRWWVHECSNLMNWLMLSSLELVHYKQAASVPPLFHSLFPSPRYDMANRSSPDANTLVLDFSGSRTVRNKFVFIIHDWVCITAQNSVVFWCNSTK